MTDTTCVIGIDGTSTGWIASIGSARNKCLTTIKFSENLDRLLSGYPQLRYLGSLIEVYQDSH